MHGRSKFVVLQPGPALVRGLFKLAERLLLRRGRMLRDRRSACAFRGVRCFEIATCSHCHGQCVKRKTSHCHHPPRQLAGQARRSLQTQTHSTESSNIRDFDAIGRPYPAKALCNEARRGWSDDPPPEREVPHTATLSGATRWRRFSCRGPRETPRSSSLSCPRGESLAPRRTSASARPSPGESLRP